MFLQIPYSIPDDYKIWLLHVLNTFSFFLVIVFIIQPNKTNGKLRENNFFLLSQREHFFLAVCIIIITKSNTELEYWKPIATSDKLNRTQATKMIQQTCVLCKHGFFSDILRNPENIVFECLVPLKWKNFHSLGTTAICWLSSLT